MRKKLLSAVALCWLLSAKSDAQSFMKSIGATINFVYDTPDYPDDVALSQTYFTYFPRFNVTEGTNSSVSVGMPLSAGVGFVSGAFGGIAGVAAGIDVPAVLDLNFGALSTMDNESDFGGYIGLGAGYQYTKLFEGEYDAMDLKSFGPLIRGGIRVGLGSYYSGKALTFGGFYKKGMGNNRLNTIGVNVLWGF